MNNKNTLTNEKNSKNVFNTDLDLDLDLDFEFDFAICHGSYIC